ncbi:MAG: M42 family metallopeptidase [Anaerolineae bacterium]|nr:M42 family metallopeptidase [Anaerolineae bacterium]
MDALTLLRRLSETPGVAGHEAPIRAVVEAELRPLVDEVQTDGLGSLIGLKRGVGNGERPRLMIAAHLDEIGLMVAGRQGAFLRLAPVGGIDDRVLPGQEVVVHTTDGPLPGVIATRPTARLPEDKHDKTLPLAELRVDLGLSEADVRARVRVGDVVTLQRPVVELRNGRVAGKAMDNRASVTTMLLTLDGLRGRQHAWDVYAVATVQEETGLRGAATSAFQIRPQVGIALDVGYGEQPGLSDVETFPLGQGPSVAWGPNVHPKLHHRLMDTAERHEIPVHFEPMPGSSGTDAWAIQTAQAGVATAILSLPTRYMHTPVETLAVRDLERTARLLAHFIAELDPSFVEELKF